MCRADAEQGQPGSGVVTWLAKGGHLAIGDLVPRSASDTGGLYSTLSLGTGRRSRASAGLLFPAHGLTLLPGEVVVQVRPAVCGLSCLLRAYRCLIGDAARLHGNEAGTAYWCVAHHCHRAAHAQVQSCLHAALLAGPDKYCRGGCDLMPARPQARVTAATVLTKPMQGVGEA